MFRWISHIVVAPDNISVDKRHMSAQAIAYKTHDRRQWTSGRGPVSYVQFRTIELLFLNWNNSITIELFQFSILGNTFEEKKQTNKQTPKKIKQNKGLISSLIFTNVRNSFTEL